ncbi:TetR/AcrR family transcriptional regulator [Kiloniella laminariae]|uniref:TetR/AcrR family transcriptional regulator n=1 Tax=Kiloniella laminariae TaxID=454162 RepID=UPI00037B3278|nr:TetR/AcrR family transcriptional regulator [Kiloniella laminariae]
MNEKTTRDHIVEAADQLFYQQGYEHTSFKDIADAVQISRGNFYYHFKTKDDILDAVIVLRLARTTGMLDRWEAEGDSPEDRICSFIHILIMNQAKIILYGCPVGTLSGELAKLNHSARGEANQLFSLFKNWLQKQFILMGCGEKSEDCALHLLARSQGAATLANAFQDEAFIKREVRMMMDWLLSCKKGAQQVSRDVTQPH